MALSQRAKANLQSWAKRGDLMAQGVLYASKGEDASGVEFIQNIINAATASTTSVHAAVFGDAVGPVSVTAGITNPDVTRNVEMAFGATWDGGNVTVTGTDALGAAQTELFTANPGNTVVGVKVFATVTAFSYAGSGVGTHATNTVSLGVGNKLGLSKKMVTDVIKVLVAGVEDLATVDKTNNAFTPSGSNLPDGVKDYEVHYQVAA